MPTTRPPEQSETEPQTTPETAPPEPTAQTPPETPQRGLTAPMPRIPDFPRPIPSERPSGAHNGAQTTTASSPASTSEGVKRAERVPLPEFRQAIREGIDLVFLIFGGLVGRYLDRRRGREFDPQHWRQTPAERAAVVDPGSRFLRRHLRDEPRAQDTLDLLLMGTGVGRYTARTVLDLEPIEDLPEERGAHA